MHPNEALARREIDLISQQDVEAHRRLYADDCVFHYPGKSALAGTYPWPPRIHGPARGGIRRRDHYT